jgi:hypothetical protein
MGYVGVKPSAVPLTSADITDGIITSAKIADGTIVNADINASAAIVSTKLSGSFGITEADQWRLTTSLTADGQVITANWEKVDTDSGGIIGTGMTESSGIFSFPSTGIYLVNIDSVIAGSAARIYAGIYIQVSTDGGSTYSVAAESFGSIYIANAASQLHGSFLLDVTSTANIKVNFYAVAAGLTIYDGNTAINRTYATFIRLGDT